MNALLMSDLGAGFFVFILGLAIVFFGMLVIVLVISLIGKIMKANDEKKAKSKAEAPVEKPAAASSDDEIDDRIKAAIVAVIAGYYFSEGNDCSFKVKRIKKLN